MDIDEHRLKAVKIKEIQRKINEHQRTYMKSKKTIEIGRTHEQQIKSMTM